MTPTDTTRSIPTQRRPDQAVDPATLSHQDYVQLQLTRSKLKVGEDCSDRAADLLGRLEAALGQVDKALLSPVLCVGCRNSCELDRVESLGYGPVQGIDLHSVDDRITVMDMHEMSFDDGAFGLVLSSHSLEHAKDPVKAGSEIRRVTKVGGIILVEVPIYYGTFDADLWDYKRPERVVELLEPVEVVWMGTGKQLDCDQQVARVIVRAVDIGA